ncbi:MAG: XRE family transcriptional regulator [Phycisphaerales bacterium]|nr:XRE family transcriptional regulator [Phycisphaerales bacterium]
MAKPRKKRWNTLKSSMTPEALARVDARVRETLAKMPLAEIRKAIGMTQAELAESIDIAQGSVSKLEHQADMYISTLRKYIHALGGELRLTAEFPGGRTIEIDRLTDLKAG